MELIKDYDCIIDYHPGKANVVADALNRKNKAFIGGLLVQGDRELLELGGLNVHLDVTSGGMLLAMLVLQSDMREKIRKAQGEDPEVMKEMNNVKVGQDSLFRVSNDGLVVMGKRIYLPNDEVLKGEVLKEAHEFKLAIHPGSTKMYRDLKESYWWPKMKREIAKYVAKCAIYQQVKMEHQRPAGELQSLSIPEWKWENITMDFVSGLPKNRKGHDAIWVIVDRLTKSSLFLHIKMGDSVEKLAQLYIKEVVRLHGVPVSIVSDRDPRFTSRLWSCIQRALGTRLNLSTAFHPQTDGQSERTIQILEDLLRSCILDFGGQWEDHLPYEALYGRRCRTTVC
jgi:hypothetical protein